MQDYTGILEARIKRTPTVESFRLRLLSKPDFIPGQFLRVLLDPAIPAGRELNKYLSFSSAPARAYIEFTKRLSESEFSKRLKALKPGDRVVLKAPMGNCVFKNEYRKIGFLIGGIGITPVISIIEHIALNGLGTDVNLIYSNKVEEEVAFKSDLDTWMAQNPGIKIYYCLDSPTPASAVGYHIGMMDADLIKTYMPDYAERTIFIFGPPKMVEIVKSLCIGLSCSADKLKIENFTGY